MHASDCIRCLGCWPMADPRLYTLRRRRCSCSLRCIFARFGDCSQWARAHGAASALFTASGGAMTVPKSPSPSTHFNKLRPRPTNCVLGHQFHLQMYLDIGMLEYAKDVYLQACEIHQVGNLGCASPIASVNSWSPYFAPCFAHRQAQYGWALASLSCGWVQ